MLVGLAVSQVALLTTTVYLHRALSHRALALGPGAVTVARVIIWTTTGIKPRQWVAVHRKHHAFTDVPGDPHSPRLLGFWRVQLTNALLYRKVARDPATVARYARDLPADRLDRILFDRSFVGLGLEVAVLCALVGWQAGLVAAGVQVTSYLALNAAVNAIGHSRGRQSYPNTAFNNRWLAWVTAGEGLHNNHHAAPTSARLSLARGEHDIGWYAISVLVRLKQASIRLSEPHIRGARPAPLAAQRAGSPR